MERFGRMPSTIPNFVTIESGSPLAKNFADHYDHNVLGFGQCCEVINAKPLAQTVDGKTCLREG